jgi:hypothetical protein
LKYTKVGSAIHNKPTRKGRKKKQKNPGINPGQPVEKGRKKRKERNTLVLTLGSAI